MSTTQFLQSMKSRHVQVGARSIFLSEAGSGPVVLMLHGGGPGASGMSNYSKNVEALSKHFRVIVPDMPGYGQTTKGLDNKDPFGDLAKNMLGMMDVLNIQRAHLVGNSLGGACSIRMAMDQPERVGRMVLMGPGGINTTRELPTPGLRHLLNYYGDGPTLERMRTFIRNYLVYDGAAVPEAMITERYKASMDPESLAHGSLLKPKGIPNFKKMDFTRDSRLDEIDHPTLVLWGTEDKVNRPAGGQTLLKRLRNCDLYLFSKVGHWVQWERAEEFNNVVTGFLQQDAQVAGAQARKTA